MEEPVCFKCGAKTGGDLRKHKDGCSYIKELCEKYQACRDFLAGKKEDTSWSRKGPRKNKKHSHTKEDLEDLELEAEDARFHAHDD